MGRSSRILVLSLVFTATPAVAQQHVPLVRAPTNVMGVAARPHMIAPRVATVPRLARPGIVARPRLVQRPGFGIRRARPNLASGYDFGEVGVLGVPGMSLGALPQWPDTGMEPGLEPGVIPAEVAPRPVCPQIIKIGKGVRHKVKTRVIYGPAQGCVRVPTAR